MSDSENQAPEIRIIEVPGLGAEIAADRKARIEDCERYNAALNALELAPNGDDYNAVMLMLCGAGYRPPHTRGR